ncbi:hypothetical protein NKR23_g1269 [Pleurostoma richardsiae]|uniref:Uncharacterized protein n=1 Tax=Pleurostoma richardsiae TaxID=41990 RepID=A0AA38RQZ7_9PEZI|nr:hypothetical protein NKR23_g1269 [Pleurostoma richardsiae]
MGVESRKAPPLPAPTETESTATSTELATDVSKTVDEKSSYSLPEDGTPVTIKTRGHKANRSQTSLLIEYFEGGKSGSAGGASGERKPSVRVRLTPSKNRKNDHIQITETKSSSGRKASLSRRQTPLTPTAGKPDIEALSALSGDRDDAKSMSSYASATEESNVSRNPIEVEIDRSGHHRRRRPASPLIPAADSKVSYQPPNMSDISAIPTDSFLDGSGPSKLGEDRRSKSPSRTGDVLAGAAAGLAAAAAADKLRSKSKSRSESREKDRVVVSKSRDKDKSDRKHRSSKSRTSSVSEQYSEDTRSPRRRSSKGNQESLVSGADSSVVSSGLSPSHRSMDQQSVRSGASKSSINNPKLLETVEDAIRRLILPELNALKREQSRHKDRRGSTTSTGTSISRDEYANDRRQLGDRYSGKSRESLKSSDRRDREARNDLAESPTHSVDQDSFEESTLDVRGTPRSSEKLKVAAAGAALGGLAAAAMDARSPAGAREQRRRRRAELKSRGADLTSEDYDESEHLPVPPMPLMSEINPSDVTRTSILSADTDRPHSASEELTPVQEVSRGLPSVESSSPTPTRTPVTLQAGLGTQHANISHGDLKALPRRRTGEFPEEFETNEYEQRGPAPSQEEYDEDEEYEAGMHPYAEPGLNEYYNTQHVPPPLNYVPYQPERRGLSPIPSVSGYTEGGSEPPNRDSRVTQNTNESYSSPDKSPRRGVSPHSASSVPSNVMSRDFEDDRSLRSSGVDYRNTTYTDDSEVGRVTPGQAVRAVDANNPNIIHPPMGVESAVASLVDGSMLDESVLTGESGHGSQGQYTQRDLMAPLEEEISQGHVTPNKRSVENHREIAEDVSRMPEHEMPRQSPEFEEYDIDEYGRKVPRARYRQSPTASEAAITGAAVGAAAAALRAAKENPRQPPIEEGDHEFVGEGVQRNKSFKDRTKEGYLPANTPTHSVDRLDDYDRAKVGHSGLPDPNDPLPELGYFARDDESQTNPSILDGRLDGAREEDEQNWTTQPGGMEEHDQYTLDDVHGKHSGHNLGPAAAVGAAALAAAAAGASHSRQPSQEHEEEWQRNSDDRKRDTLVTNPYEGASPIVNLPGLNDPLLGGVDDYDTGGYGVGYNERSPVGHKVVDEGYISQGPNKTPDMQVKGKAVEFSDQPNLAGVEDPFYTGPKHTRHLSGMSQGMASPLYDAATGTGIDRIESKDIIALMQHLMVRDAQRSARDTEILVTLVRSAAEMRNSFEDIKRLLADTEDVIITEVKDNTEKTVQRAIGGPRPLPGSGARSLQGAGSVAGTDDLRAKKQNLFRRALKGLSAKGTNDLGRIEEMLMQLLTEVDTLKAQTAPGASASNQGNQSYDNLQPAVQYEQDRGYEPEGNAGTSTASHASQSGHLSIPQSRGTSAKQGYVERKFSDHRISTVPEANEDEYDYHGHQSSSHHDNPDMLLSPNHDVQRGSSLPLDTPPQTAVPAQASLSNENTPRTEKGKKHKSSGSSSWFPKISRWSETTASSVGKAFRSSRSNKDNDGSDFHQPPSRSGSDLVAYDDYDHMDPYGDDKLHTGFSETDLRQPAAGEASPIPHQPPLPATYMTPEDPKYKAHRNSLNLQHPQPRPGQTEFFRTTLESQAQEFDSPMSPRSADWAGSATSLHRFPGQNQQRYSNGTGGAGAGEEKYWGSSPVVGSSSQAPPRPPKEPLDPSQLRQTPPKSNRISKLQKSSPLPYHSVESGYGTATHGAPSVSYTGSPKLENRNLSGALGVPTRRPSGPRAMTPKSAGSVDSNGEEGDSSARRRKRDTFGTLASDNTDTF